MKKILLRFLLGLAYICITTIFLITHIQNISGTLPRMLATFEAFALFISSLVVLMLYIKIKDKFNNSEASDNPEKALALAEIPIRQSEEEFQKATAVYHFSIRESEVAWLLFRGYTNRQIGEELFIAESTVKKHVTHIYEKMQVTGRKEFRLILMENIQKTL